MIEINLLPEEYRKKKKVPITERLKKIKGLVLPLAGVLIGVVLIVILLVFIYPSWQQKILAKLEQKWAGLADDYQEAKKLEEEKKVLVEESNWTEEIMASRLLWAAALNYISDALPQEIQLTEMVTRKEQERKALIISGLVPALPGELAIEEFVKRLRENVSLQEYFSELLPPSTRTEERAIKTFTLKCYLSDKYSLKEEKK